MMKLMIGYISGKLIDVDPKSLTVSAGGTGYRIVVSPETSNYFVGKVGEEVDVWVHTAVRETAIELFGFREKSERTFFELLITISGIGPRSALSILSLSPIETLRSAISSGNVGYLTKISGIGKKTAEKIVLELQGKIGEIESGSYDTEETDVLEALKSLGYQERNIREALKAIPKEVTSTASRVKEALKFLGS